MIPPAPWGWGVFHNLIGSEMKTTTLSRVTENENSQTFPRIIPHNDGWDEDRQAALEAETTPLEKLLPEDFERYCDLFFKYNKRTPYFVRTSYDGKFHCPKGRRKDGEEYYRPCYPGLIAKMLDLDHWNSLKPDKKQYQHLWIALNAGRCSALKAIDFDNKDNLLGTYRSVSDDLVRPLATLTLEHVQAIKRIYDAFPNHIWCISSRTLGLHIWEQLPKPLPLELIDARNRPTLRRIGLGSTEIHPMRGRAFRRPFGEDYLTITNDGLLSRWTKQLDFFEFKAETPRFEEVYRALQQKASDALKHFKRWGSPESHKLMAAIYCKKPHLAKYCKVKDLISIEPAIEEFKRMDNWAEKGFPDVMPVSEPVPVEVKELGRGKNTPHQPAAGVALAPKTKNKTTCDIDLSDVCNGQWVQNCQKWAENGLPCEDSIFPVVSQLARWFFFIEFWHLSKDERIEQIVELITAFCMEKNNNFISRLNAGLQEEVESHVERIVETAIKEVDQKGKALFAVVRQKRERGEYSKLIWLEPVIRGVEQKDAEPVKQRETVLPSSSLVGINRCCTLSGNDSSATTRRKDAEGWEFVPNDTPLPDPLMEGIESYYFGNNLTTYKPTMKKLIRFLNHLADNGEARLSVKSLKKMGFSNDRQRQHLKNLEKARIITKGSYSSALGLGTLYRLTKRAKEMFAAERGQKALIA